LEHPIKDPRGFTLQIWWRYFKQFWPYIEENCFDHDLYQEFELIGLEITGMEVREGGRLAQKEFRGFLKEIGFSKHHGKWVRREHNKNELWWDVYHKTGRGN
jgi:hypothetical protein